jgi:phenylalanyl-tRNA synthetase beta chain
MKVSINWLKQFTDIDISIDELVAKIGAQLGAVEEVVDLGKKYQGILVAKVVSCEKHPNADKLSVCWVDDGGKAKNVERNEKGYVQVVCGAPNVREGLIVAWLPPGTTVPATFDKDPFVLESKDLRGVVSNGMIASLAELAIGDDHSGIVELDIEAAPGSDFADLYELNDYIIDIENKMFTHRPDCFGILGIAREVAGIQHKPFKSPDWYRAPLDRIKPGKSSLQLTVKNEITDLVPRFMAVAMADVTIKPSPLIIQTYLSRVGLRPINNVVDVTNYLMVLTGQPIHAYDYDKLNGASLETRKSRKGDKLKLLSGKELAFEDDATVLITSGDIPVGVGGVMGGADTEVSEGTKNIVIECANFDMYSIRRTSMKYGLFTDAVTRFNKGQSPLQNDVVLEETVATMQFVSGAHVASEVSDLKNDIKPKLAVEATSDFINVRLGSNLATEDMARLLENVEFAVDAHADSLKVTPGYWRTDVDIAEDIVEEVGRLHGYDLLPIKLPERSIKAIQPNPMLELKSKIRDALSRAGANEVLTYSFVHGDLLDKVQQNREQAYKLSNAISPELQYYRMSLLPSLLEKVYPNIKSGFNTFALFELNKVHSKLWVEEELPKELENLGLVIAADNKTKREGAAFYHARKYLDNLAEGLGIELRYKPIPEPGEHPGAALFEPARSARVYLAETEKIIGAVGEFKQDIKKALKLPDYTAGFEVSLGEKLLKAGAKYKPLSRYPSVEQDISLRIKADMPFGEVADFLAENIKAPEELVYSFYPIDIYQKQEIRHITFRLKIASYSKTMKAQEVNLLLDDLAAKAHDKFGAERL